MKKTTPVEQIKSALWAMKALEYPRTFSLTEFCDIISQQFDEKDIITALRELVTDRELYVTAAESLLISPASRPSERWVKYYRENLEQALANYFNYYREPLMP